MKRLFYTTDDLNEAKTISDEIHDIGIDDDHFYVVSRDEEGLDQNHLHGAKTLDQAHVLDTKTRAHYFGMAAMVLAIIVMIVAFDLSLVNLVLTAAVGAIVYGLIKFLSQKVGNFFDAYLKGVLDDHLDNGEAVVVIDVNKKQAKRVSECLKKHPGAHLILEGSSMAVPMAN